MPDTNPSSTPPSSSLEPPKPTPAPPSPLAARSPTSPTETHLPTTTNNNNNNHSPLPPLILALSGPTSSGKTSLATALHAIYPPPHSTLIHADDFYKTDDAIPFISIKGSGGGEGGEAGFERVQDWDCVEALDLGALEGVVRGLRDGGLEGEGELGMMVRQGNFEKGEEGEGIKGIPDSLIARLKSSTPPQQPLIILDGFLLFGTSVPPTLKSLFDIKILLRASREEAKERRERRNGYVTLEGFWEDPRGYFEGVVWPGYGREYGGVEGRVGAGGGFDEVEGVWCSDPGWGLERCLEWVVGVVRGGGKMGDGEGEGRGG